MKESINLIKSMTRKQLEEFAVELFNTATENKRIADDVMERYSNLLSQSICAEFDETSVPEC